MSDVFERAKEDALSFLGEGAEVVDARNSNIIGLTGEPVAWPEKVVLYIPFFVCVKYWLVALKKAIEYKQTTKWIAIIPGICCEDELCYPQASKLPILVQCAMFDDEREINFSCWICYGGDRIQDFVATFQKYGPVMGVLIPKEK